ncbi:major facilitator superfamily domain-containing protein [Sphaerosporella brunnea]|uniref:Major facilitator superfamily domain-containing protein n=1 Tax=Sphaerosporella brunnea TaxID=1250544 RepID=A0A5J5EWL7_9PEZI|nr:major facilitator superfamily domain-containing protein [Sphaerosporella brunnea]
MPRNITPKRAAFQRRQSSYHYQTFPGVVPPASRGRPPHSKIHNDSPRGGICSGSSSLRSGLDGGSNGGSPIPWRQLIILAIISLAEQTALNSISPYLPEMAATFPEVAQGKVGLYVGIIASSFAAAQFATNVFWGHLSDRIGRKPVILLGTFLTSLCFFAFGFCRTLPQAIVVQVLMGLFNANAGVVSTVLGEITDKSNQTSAFAWLPIIYGLGAITGPIIGGVLSGASKHPSGPLSRLFSKFPYLLPNVVCCMILLVGLVLSFFMLDESLHEAQRLPPLSQRVKCLFSWLWQFTASYRPSFVRFGEGSAWEEEYGSPQRTLAESCPALLPDRTEEISYRSIMVPQIIFLMITYALFNLSNIAFNSLYPIYTSAPRPVGRAMSPEEIGLMLSLSGGIGIFFQAFLFTPIQKRLGNIWSYRAAFLGFVVSFIAMPLVGRNEDEPKAWLYTELSATLLVKSISAVGGLTCAMLLITNASPKPSTLGTLNGLAQTLSAGGRAFAPFVSGALFTAGFKMKGGEWLPWGLFGGIALLGLGLSFGLSWPGFESDDEEAEPLLPGHSPVPEGGEDNGSVRD